MANVQIDDLNPLPSATDAVVLPVDNGIQTFKASFAQLREYFGFPIGGICMWGAAVPSPNFLICDGTEISRTTYSALFAVIGTTYGVGNNSTTFNLPPFHAIVPRGVGTQTINGRSKVGPALGQIQEDQTQRNTGAITFRPIFSGDTEIPTGSLSSSAGSNFSNTGIAANNRTRTILNIDSSTSPNARASSTTDGETRPTSLGVHFVIKWR